MISLVVKMARHTTVQLRERILILSKSGKTSRDIASVLGVGKSTVNDLLAKHRSGLSLKDKPRSGRPKKTSVQLDRIIKRKSTAAVKKTAIDFCRELSEENKADVSGRAVSRRLSQVGLLGHVGRKTAFISNRNQKVRLEFPLKHQNWTVDYSKKVGFSDESEFNLFGNDGRRYVKRPRGARNDSRYAIFTVKHGGGNVLVWGIS